MSKADKIPLNKWDAYKGPFPEISSMPHIIIIIFIDETSTLLKYFYITSKVDKAKRIYKNDPLALVELSKSDWEKLHKNKPSCIQCGSNTKHLHEIEIKRFKELYDNDKVKYFGKIPQNVKDKIIKSIWLSTTYSNKEKNKYAGEIRKSPENMKNTIELIRNSKKYTEEEKEDLYKFIKSRFNS